MQVKSWVLVTALGVGLSMPIASSAQTGQGGTVQEPGTTAPPPTATPPPAAQPADPLAPAVPALGNQWIVSGFVGSNFGAATEDTSANFGASVGYLWNGWVGAEFAAGFTPNFQHADAAFLDANPNVNTYMVNAVGAVPLGMDGQWQPFVSGGIGGITLRSDLLADEATVSNNEERFGGNIGFGLMTFAGNWGLRADVRYFRAFGTAADEQFQNGVPADDVNLLEGLDFWRANIGVAYRW